MLVAAIQIPEGVPVHEETIASTGPRDLAIGIHHTVSMYSAPTSLTMAYNGGAGALTLYGAQMATGILMAMMYTAGEEVAYHVLDGLPT